VINKSSVIMMTVMLRCCWCCWWQWQITLIWLQRWVWLQFHGRLRAAVWMRRPSVWAKVLSLNILFREYTSYITNWRRIAGYC